MEYMYMYPYDKPIRRTGLHSRAVTFPRTFVIGWKGNLSEQATTYMYKQLYGPHNTQRADTVVLVQVQTVLYSTGHPR